MRTYLRLYGLVLVVIMVGAMVLTSCTTDSSPAGTPVSGATSNKPEGSLTIGMSFNNNQWDPQIGQTSAYIFVEAAVYDSIAELNPMGATRPGLAERWEISSDGLTHTFYIRKGV
ncbi:MAG: hypothetical protein Q7O66_16905, partial [Dehalococcoidia bacterium]|nr:hypothetical protein [Dehalococcoidia bacterium]